MKLRTFLILFILSSIALTMMNDYITLGLKDLNIENEKTEQERQRALGVSEDLLVANQYTTRFARAYVATGLLVRREFYQDILDILDGKMAAPVNYDDDYWDQVAGDLIPPPAHTTEGGKSIEDIFLSLNITNAEFNKLKEAKSKIYELSKTEIKAMNMAQAYYAGISQKSAGKQGKAELQAATNLVNSIEYNVGNAEIARELSAFKGMIKNRYADKISDISKRYNDFMRLNVALSAGLYTMILLSALYLYFRIQRRGTEAISTLHKISDGELSARSRTSGSDEIGHLASLVNWAGSNLQAKMSELEDKIANTELLMDELKRERDRSDKLLHNILPSAIAERLSNGEAAIAEVYPEVTVLFADIVGFTELSEKLGPSETVNMLNLLFGQFDELADKCGVEKIKTIGDCYMVVAGVPNRDPLHCQHIAAFALEALNYAHTLAKDSPYDVRLRIGIHTGTVAAGVVGKKRFSYDLWGDVVNVASRFETASEHNRIHVSEAVKFRLSDDFLFLDGGEVKLKGKGAVRSFYLLGKKENMPDVLEFRKA
jgi:adenylate cyclase